MALFNESLIHPYAYLIGGIIFLAIWLALFIIRKDLRRQMLVMSLIGSIFTPIALVFLPDYWYPEHILGSFLGIEDYLFAFAIAGIGSVIYEATAGKTHTLCDCRKRSQKDLLIIALGAVAILLVLTFAFDLNSIYSNYVAFFAIFGFIIFFRRDLLWQSLMSGFMVGLLMFFFYQIWIAIYPGIIEHWWKLENISGILVLGVPLEEIVWGFSWGIAGGSLYEFMRGVGMKNKIRNQFHQIVLNR